MALNYYIRSGQKRLRCGYTTGTCAALAAAGATVSLLSGKEPETVSLMTPKGVLVETAPAFVMIKEETAVCGIVKDGGDDADVTHGLTIEAHVKKRRYPGIFIDGGEGVGRVTKPGLDQPVGSAAINRVPRRMIKEQVQLVCDRFRYEGGVEVLICIPGGKETAGKTFNPMLGVEGGLSVLGTSGIVEPMSEQALVDTIAVELRQAAALGHKRLILTPGNYGEDFLRESGIAGKTVPVVKCSNFIGDALDLAGIHPFEEVLLVGHIGKLVKLAGGVMNTHSRYADCRTELICAHAALCGASGEVCASLMQAVSTDACIEILDSVHLRDAVLESLLQAVQRHLEHRVLGKYQIGAVLFSNQYGLLGETRTAKEIMRSWMSGYSPILQGKGRERPPVILPPLL